MESNEQNKLMSCIETEAWTRGRDRQLSEGEGKERTERKKVKGLAKEHSV